MMWLSLVLLSCLQAPAEAKTPLDERLRDELLARMQVEQEVRLELMRALPNGGAFDPAHANDPAVRELLERMGAIDADNLAWFRTIVREKGWPGRAMVGAEAAQAAFLIVQHATSDLDFMAECLPRLGEAHRAGDARGEWVALLTDRLLVLKEHRPQRYGSQLELVEGALRPSAIEDEAHVDERRAALQMPPLAEYLAMANRLSSPTDDEGFTPLFNGKDLAGWKLGGDDLAGKAATADGRFSVEDGILRIEGSTDSPPRMTEIDTQESFDDDFTLRFEFRAAPSANSGLHLRDKVFAHQLQIRDYPRVGPYTNLKGFREGGWNAVEVVVRGSKARCTCNGEVLEEALAIPDHGRLSLQSETNSVEYRALRIKTSKSFDNRAK